MQAFYHGAFTAFIQAIHICSRQKGVSYAGQVAGLVGRPEKSLESFAACPAPDNPLVAFLGNEGCVPLVSLRSRQCVGDLKMSGTVRTAAFSADGLELLTSGAVLLTVLIIVASDV